MISEKYKCIFVHIPKAAGQSIEHFFLNSHGLSWDRREPLLLRYNPDPKKGPERLAHLTAREYTSYEWVSRNTFKEYFKFSFVRNPWDRLVSEYKYRNHDQLMSFKEFVLYNLPTKNLYSDNYRHILPQYDFLHDESGNLLVDFVGRFENLQTDFDYVCSKLNITNSALPFINSSNKPTSQLGKVKNFIQIKNVGTAKEKSKNKGYISYYDRNTRKIIEQIYRNDIDTFGYQFGE